MPQDRTGELPRRRWWLKPLMILGIIGALIFGFLWSYRRSEPSRLSTQARQYLDAGDYRNAALVLRRALTVSPQNPEALRLMAELADRLEAPTAVEWHEQVVALHPDSNADRTAWVTSAIRSRRLAAAEEALEGAPATFRITAEYEAMRGLVAMGKGQWKEAAQAFEEATRRDPGRESYQFNHALTQIQSPEEGVLQAGVQKLTKLSAFGSFASPAKRALIRLLMRHQRYGEALQYCEALLATPDATFEDQLTRLDLLRILQKQEFSKAMQEAQAIAVKAPEQVAALLSWSVRNGFAGEARKWVDSLDLKWREDPKVAEAYAEVLAESADWEALAEFTARQLSWMRGNSMRHAFAALAAEKQNRSEAAAGQWQLAVQSAIENYETTMAVAYFAHRASWRPRLTEVLWAATNRPDSEWALRMLHRLCAEDGNTEGMLRVAKRLLALNPEDERARNNAVILALLLGEPPSQHLEVARSLHEKAPGDPVFATTHAFALHLAGRTKEGLAIIQKLPVEVRRRPDTALYHAVLLGADGRHPQAAEAAELARKGTMLPEEKKLLSSVVGGA